MRKIDQKITQASDPEALLWHLQLTLNASYSEAKLAFQRQLENYEILATRIKQIQAALPKHAYDVTMEDGLDKATVNPRNPAPHEPRRPKKIRSGDSPRRRLPPAAKER